MRAEPPAGKPSIPASGSDRARPKRARPRRRRPRSMHAGNDARAPRRRAAFRPGRAHPEIRRRRSVARERRSLSRRSKASSWPSPTTWSNSDRASLCFYGQDASRSTSRPCSIASNATQPSRTSNGGTSGPLSSRELTVVRYLASRLTYKEIAAELCVSTNTLKTHVRRVHQKLGVSSRLEAVTEARRLGLF